MEAITAVRTVVLIARNRKEIGKILLVVTAAILTPILLLVALYLQIMSAFAPDGILQSDEYIDATESAVYQSLQGILSTYYETLREDMADHRDDIIEEHTYTYTPKNENGEDIVDENGNPVEITVVPTVTRRLNDIPKSLIIAYLIMVDGMDTGTGAVDEELVKNFLDNISTIEEKDQGNDSWLVENKVLSVEEIAEKYFRDESEKNQFSILCNAYGEYFDVAQTIIIADDGSESTEGYLPANLSSVPLYLQYDKEWGTVPYGNGTIKKNGCCPTCLAMVLSYLCQQSIYPNDVVAWAGNRYYVNGSGTSWSIFSPAAEHWEVKCTNIGKNQNAMKEALSKGKLVIASMGPGTFTKGGHFIVLTGITDDGKIRVNDPNDNASKKHIEKSFEVSLILRECKNMWVFEK